MDMQIETTVRFNEIWGS